jgi:hypothetical protein
VFVSNPFPVNVIFYPPGNPTVGLLDYTYDPYTVKVYNSVELQKANLSSITYCIAYFPTGRLVNVIIKLVAVLVVTTPSFLIPGNTSTNTKAVVPAKLVPPNVIVTIVGSPLNTVHNTVELYSTVGVVMTLEIKGESLIA